MRLLPYSIRLFRYSIEAYPNAQDQSPIWRAASAARCARGYCAIWRFWFSINKSQIGRRNPSLTTGPASVKSI